jgi:HEPN domain-containing protein
MPNKAYALEWLTFAKKNLNTAILLSDVNHYTDIIGVEIQQSLEKLLQAVAANENIKIPKEHDLVKIYLIIESSFIELEEDEVVLLKIATNYYKEDRYPNPNYSLPTREEIQEVLEFTKNLFEEICNSLNIKLSEVKC